MGMITNIMTFTIALSFFLSITTFGQNQVTSPMTDVLNGSDTLVNQLIAFFTNPLNLAGLGAAAIILGQASFPNPWAIFFIPAAFFLAWFTLPVSLFNGNLGFNDPNGLLLIQLFRTMLEVAFTVSVLSWFKGGGEL